LTAPARAQPIAAPPDEAVTDGVPTMTFKLSALLLAGSVLASAAAFAQSADDKKWVNQCLSDNKDAKVAASVVNTYCTCMNGKMSDNETRSITQWEKANPNARKACEQEAGWS